MTSGLPPRLWCLRFSQRGQVLGGCLLEAVTFEDAIRAAARAALSPVKCMIEGQPVEGQPPSPGWQERFLSPEEVAQVWPGPVAW